MRLINTTTLELESFFGDQVPQYAILSHRWLPDDDEPSFRDWRDPEEREKKPGFQKIVAASRLALESGLGYLWVDTNCINKESSAELSEAINSMFAWYRDSAVCYAYLADVASPGEFRQSEWFERGWTLQELLAPAKVDFYSREWTRLGSRSDGHLADDIIQSTGIDIEYLAGRNRVSLKSASVARRMHWLSRRKTTRAEDMAYCMLGIFDINMPLLYGEGTKAFTRLQEEIIKVSNDHTIFCWDWDTGSVPRNWVSMLAPSPYCFSGSSRDMVPCERGDRVSVYSMTNAGLSISLPLIQTWGLFFAVLDAGDPPSIRNRFRACIPVAGDVKSRRTMRRVGFPTSCIQLPGQWAVSEESVFVQARPSEPPSPPLVEHGQGPPANHGLIVALDDMKQLSGSDNHLLTPNPSSRLLDLRTKDEMIIKSHPAGAFNRVLSLYSLPNIERRRVDGGLLYLASSAYGGSRCLLFLGAKLWPGNQLMWYCESLPPGLWEGDRAELLAKLLSRAYEAQHPRLEHHDYARGGAVVCIRGHTVQPDGGQIRVCYVSFNEPRMRRHWYRSGPAVAAEVEPRMELYPSLLEGPMVAVKAKDEPPRQRKFSFFSSSDTARRGS